MSKKRTQPEQPAGTGRRSVLRAIGISLFFLMVGLGAMWLHFRLGEQTTVGLETLDSTPPLLPTEQVAPNRVRLFFTADGALLSPETSEIAPRASIYERTSATLQALLRGPRSRVLQSPIPRRVKVRGLYVSTGSVVLDFSTQLRNGLAGGPSTEVLCVYSIVNTVLLNCPDLKTVTVLIEGLPVETLLGYLDLSAPLVENVALLAPENEPSNAPR